MVGYGAMGHIAAQWIKHLKDKTEQTMPNGWAKCIIG